MTKIYNYFYNVNIIGLQLKYLPMEIKSTINIILKDLEEARTLIDDLKNYREFRSFRLRWQKQNAAAPRM
ncbi:MAG: hypothetical protein R2744_12485 [Bacteroidales bacterium]